MEFSWFFCTRSQYDIWKWLDTSLCISEYFHFFRPRIALALNRHETVPWEIGLAMDFSLPFFHTLLKRYMEVDGIHCVPFGTLSFFRPPRGMSCLGLTRQEIVPWAKLA